MSAPRLVSVLALSLAACAAWESSTPSYTPPPAEQPTPSHYAPPPPGDPREPYTPPPPDAPKVGEMKAAIASVQWIEDCPEPKPAAEAPGALSPGGAPAAGVAIPSAQQESLPNVKMGASSRMRGDGVWQQPCSQSTVQLAVSADFSGQFRIDAVRVIDANTKQRVGTTALRQPTRWDTGTYEAWDMRVTAGTEVKVSYKLGEPEGSIMGPILLELDVAIDGVRRTIRSNEFSREPPHMVVT